VVAVSSKVRTIVFSDSSVLSCAARASAVPSAATPSPTTPMMSAAVIVPTVVSSVTTVSEIPPPPIPAAIVNPLPKSYEAATAESACPPRFAVPQSPSRSVNAP
jgi:hypothetical protein